jgi:integrase
MANGEVIQLRARWPSNFNRRRWDPIRKAAGLPGLHLHDLRHLYVSRIRDAGLSSALSEQLVGHSDERTHRGYTQPSKAPTR